MERGIIEQGMPPQGTSEGDIRGRGGVAPEQQGEEQLLDKFLQTSADVVKGNREILKKNIENTGLARAASKVFNHVDQQFQGLPDMVRFFGGIGVLTQIAEAAEKDGVKNLSEEERMKALATVLSEQIKKGIESGQYEPNEMLKAAEQAQAMLQASNQAQGKPPQGGM